MVEEAAVDSSSGERDREGLCLGLHGDDVMLKDMVGGDDGASKDGGASKTVGGNPVVDQVVRRSVWERLEPSSGNVSLQSKSFASVVGSVPKPELEFFPVEKDSPGRVVIPLSLSRGIAKSLRVVLVGYFLGPRIPFPIVLRAAHSAWGKFGFKDAMVNNHGFFFFRFNDEGGCLNVVESSPLMIKGVPLFVSPWDPSKGVSKPVHTSCPLWIKFFNIPLVAFNREGICRIASAVGIPLRMDACTSSTCDNLWGRTSFAKVLVDVWATGALKREVEVVIPHLSGEGEDIIKVVLEYEWEPTQCSVCKIFGHTDAMCVHGIHGKQVKDMERKMGKVDGDGFQMARRKQWRQKGGNNVSKQSRSGTSGCTKPVDSACLDTLVGVGSVKQVISSRPKEVITSLNTESVSCLDKAVSHPGGDHVEGRGSPLGSVKEVADKGGAFCTVNAGSTPCAKEGQDNGVESNQKDTNLVHSVVNTFKSVSMLRRGTLVSNNRFSPLSDDDASDEDDMEIIDTDRAHESGGVETTSGPNPVQVSMKKGEESNLLV